MNLVYISDLCLGGVTPLISFAIRIKNEANHLECLIDSIRKQDCRFPAELVFLDSGSSDGSLEIIKKYADKIYLINTNDFQFGKSCNQLISSCIGTYVVLLSGHVYFEDVSAVAKAVRVLEGDSSIAAVYFGQKTKDSLNVDYSPYENLFLCRRFPPINKYISYIGNHPSISNAATIIRRDVWEKERFPEISASEDIIWAKKIKSLHWNIYYLGTSQVIHNHNETPEQIYQRVKINKLAQFGMSSQPTKVIASFVKVFLGLVILEKTSIITAVRFAKAHARAYIK